ANSPAWASWLDGNASAATSDPKANSASDKENNRAKYVWWGNAGVYAGGSPERRTYSWTINDGADTKAAYFMTFSTSAMRPGDPPNPTSCPNGVCAETKAFLMIDQVIAAEGY
ncbi:MAG: hypothetical protein LBR13_01220, partial [Dysgonamonadaceae bacterium]|nr:hypothetical protein [Dysgonamonadaceae bacterium]